MKILVMGGTGFIGRPLVKELVNAEHEVHCADSWAVKPAEPVDARARRIRCDVREPIPLQALLYKEEYDVIYWLAAQQGYDAPARAFAKVNVEPVYTLHDAFRVKPECRPQKIILASSQAVYEPGSEVAEGQRKEPLSIYGLSKWQQEEAFSRVARDFDITLVAMRYSIVLGPGQSLDTHESGVIRNWYRAWKKGEPAEVYGDGTQERDFVHIDDVTRANHSALDCESPFDPWTAFNIGGHVSTILDLAKLFSYICDKRFPHLIPPFKYRVLNRTTRPGGEYTLTSCWDWASGELEWEPTKKINEMLIDFLEHAQ